MHTMNQINGMGYICASFYFSIPVNYMTYDLCIFYRGVVITYNLPDFDTGLNLTREALVGIYNGTVLFWNDDLISSANPRLTRKLPYERISVVVRKDESGTTASFTRALSAFDSRLTESMA